MMGNHIYYSFNKFKSNFFINLIFITYYVNFGHQFNIKNFYLKLKYMLFYNILNLAIFLFHNYLNL